MKVYNDFKSLYKSQGIPNLAETKRLWEEKQKKEKESKQFLRTGQNFSVSDKSNSGNSMTFYGDYSELGDTQTFDVTQPETDSSMKITPKYYATPSVTTSGKQIPDYITEAKVKSPIAVVKGNTYRYRDTIKRYGGRWDAANKVWVFYDSEDLDDFKSLLRGSGRNIWVEPVTQNRYSLTSPENDDYAW